MVFITFNPGILQAVDLCQVDGSAVQHPELTRSVLNPNSDTPPWNEHVELVRVEVASHTFVIADRPDPAIRG